MFRTAPKVATLVDADGHESEVPVDGLRAGQRLLVKPGSLFPVDAEIVKGKTASDESNLTGEATPVEKTLGDTVLAGTINLWGVVELVVLRPASESALQKVIRLIHEAQHLKAPSQRFTDKFGTRYTYAILGLALGMFFYLVARDEIAAVCFHGSGPQRVLPGDDAAGRGVAVRAGAIDSFGGAGGHRVGRQTRHSVSRRRRGGEARRGERGGSR